MKKIFTFIFTFVFIFNLNINDANAAISPCITENHIPQIYGISGPTSIESGESTIGTVSASDEPGEILYYSIDWGDGNISPKQSVVFYVHGRKHVEEVTFGHSYLNAGTYTVTAIVENTCNNKSQASITVKVRNLTPNYYPNNVVDDKCSYWADKCSICTRDYIGGTPHCTYTCSNIALGLKPVCYTYFQTQTQQNNLWGYYQTPQWQNNGGYNYPTYYDGGYNDNSYGYDGYDDYDGGSSVF